MLAQDWSFWFSEAESNAPTEGAANAVTQIETELYRSDVFRRAVEQLEQATPDSETAQECLKSIARKAIRLAMQHVQTETIPDKSNPAFTATRSAEGMAVAPFSRRKPLHAVQVDQAEEHRQACLRQLGAQIRAAREARSMSLTELHSKTLVPIHQLQAIELGHGTHFPEDVYLRGFVRRIARVLQLDSAELLESLPTPDPNKSVVPSWYHPQQKKAGNSALQSTHFYLGYAALMTGGLVWLSHQATPASPDPMSSEPSHTAPDGRQASNTQKVSAGSQVAPPERF